jgi:hypothetical protein
MLLDPINLARKKRSTLYQLISSTKVVRLAKYSNVVSSMVPNESEVQSHQDDSCVVTRVIVNDHSARISTVGDEHLATSNSQSQGRIISSKNSKFGS